MTPKFSFAGVALANLSIKSPVSHAHAGAVSNAMSNQTRKNFERQEIRGAMSCAEGGMYIDSSSN